jgi:signal transduction histidine kinase
VTGGAASFPSAGGTRAAGAPERVLTRRTLPLYAAAWLPLVAAYAVGITAQGVAADDALVSAASTVLVAALLGVPAIERAARRATRRPGIARLLGAHLVGALLYASAWVLGTLAQMAAFAPAATTRAFLHQNAAWEWGSGLFLYGVLAGVGHAVAVGRQLREREAASARAELHALRAQLDPHFLFNTLHSLTALARRDPAAVERGLETFGALLRYVLDASRGRGADAAGAGGDDVVALEEELAFVRDYLALERLRLGERLHVEEALDDDALECVVPPFTLQALVENAIRHGLAPRAAGGTLRLAARVDGDGRLRLEVADDGVGCDGAGLPAADGLGLRLVRRRLAARFGPTARLEVVTAPAQGFRVRLSLPAELPRARTGAHRGTRAAASSPAPATLSARAP